MSVTASGYLRIQAQDSSAWMDFGTSVLGLMEADREDAQGARFLRMDDHPFRFMIEAGDSDKLIAAGLEYSTEAAWQGALDALQAAGIKDSGHWLDIIEARVTTGATGSRWISTHWKQFGDSAQLVRDYIAQAKTNKPVHQWQDPGT